MARSASSKRTPSFIAPERLYSLRGFYEASGITPTRTREARLQGLCLETIEVGRRKFVRGAAAIEFIESLASL